LGRKYELNQLHPVPASQNPYKRGEAINANGHDDCGTMMSPSGAAITGQAAINLQMVCGADPNPFRPFLGVGDITRFDNGASSSYNALQAELRRSQGRLQVNVSYTFSHPIDDASDGGVFGDGGILNGYNPHAFRASSNFDQRHQISISSVYSLPLFNGTGWRNRLLGGWEVSGIGLWQTGTPFSVYTSSANFDNAGLGNNIATNAGAGQSYADVISNPKQGIPSSAGTSFGPFIYNPSAFALPTGLTLGTPGEISFATRVTETSIWRSSRASR